jgi:hypothetical protein
MSVRDKLFKKYGELPSGVHKFTDRIVVTTIKVSESNGLKQIRAKGDKWIAKKKSRFGR